MSATSNEHGILLSTGLLTSGLILEHMQRPANRQAGARERSSTKADYWILASLLQIFGPMVEAG